MLSVLTPCSEAATGKKSGFEYKKDQVPKIPNKTQNTSIPMAFALLNLSTEESSFSTTRNLLFIFMLFAITEIARMMKTTDKRASK
jgi:hypothetical protein